MRTRHIPPFAVRLSVPPRKSNPRSRVAENQGCVPPAGATDGRESGRQSFPPEVTAGGRATANLARVVSSDCHSPGSWSARRRAPAASVSTSSVQRRRPSARPASTTHPCPLVARARSGPAPRRGAGTRPCALPTRRNCPERRPASIMRWTVLMCTLLPGTFAGNIGKPPPAGSVHAVDGDDVRLRWRHSRLGAH